MSDNVTTMYEAPGPHPVPLDVEGMQYLRSPFERRGPDEQYLIDDTFTHCMYELGPTHMRINDAVWGEGYIGDKPYDAMLIELAHTPLFQRLQAVEQLTLGPDFATMPNSMYFSRWQHLWGSVLLVRKMMEGREDFTDREKIIFQARTLISDAGTADFSHLTDWLFQGPGQKENLHDLELQDILRVTGIEEIVNRYGITLDEIVFPDIEDFVECPPPDLCIDRLDYGLREMLRWTIPTIPLHLYHNELQNPQSLFEIDANNHFVVKSKKFATILAAGFSILATEHWAQPPHRLQLQLLQSAVRYGTVEEVQFGSMALRDALYGIDDDLHHHFQTWDMIHLNDTMKQIARTQRRIFKQARRADLDQVFMGIRRPNWRFPEFPDPLKPYSWQSEEFGAPYSPSIMIEEVDASELTGNVLQATDKGLAVELPPLKPRYINPRVKTRTGGSMRLSQFGNGCKQYLAGQKATMSKAYRATVLMRPDIARSIEAKHLKAERDWNILLQRPRSEDQLRTKIEETVAFGKIALHGFDMVNNVGRYSALTALKSTVSMET